MDNLVWEYNYYRKNLPIEFKIKGNSSPIKQIICGAQHIFAFLKNNKIYCCGRNDYGQLGFFDNKIINIPIEFKIEKNSSAIKRIICGRHHTFAICENKKIYCCGYNLNGQLGLGDNAYRNIPVEFSDGKEEWEFFGEEKMNCLEWKEIKFLWIAFYKEDSKKLSFGKFSKRYD